MECRAGQAPALENGEPGHGSITAIFPGLFAVMERAQIHSCVSSANTTPTLSIGTASKFWNEPGKRAVLNKTSPASAFLGPKCQQTQSIMAQAELWPALRHPAQPNPQPTMIPEPWRIHEITREGKSVIRSFKSLCRSHEGFQGDSATQTKIASSQAKP